MTTVEHWLRRPLARQTGPVPEDFVPLDDERGARQDSEWLISEEGRLRWTFLKELTLFALARTAPTRLDRVKTWSRALALEQLSLPDRYQMAASIIRHLDEDEPALIDCLAKWLFRGQTSDTQQIQLWSQHLAGVDPVPDELVALRKGLVRRLCEELNTVRREARERARKAGTSGSP
jgi:hypothetical protein